MIFSEYLSDLYNHPSAKFNLCTKDQFCTNKEDGSVGAQKEMTWTTKSTETLIDTRYLKVKKNDVILPDGSEISDFYTVTIPDASGVVAITAQNKILLKSEYRYSQGEDLIEIPAGVFEPGETDTLEVAKRELLEETGFFLMIGCTWVQQ